MLKSHKPIEDVDKVLDGRYSVHSSVTAIVVVCFF